MHVFSDPSNLDVYLTGFLWILKLTAAGTVGALVLGVLLAAMRVSPVPVLRGFGTLWVNTFRNTPLTLIVFFCYFGLFSTLGLSLSDDIDLNNYWLGVIGLSVYTAAFVCEAIRSGINTVPVGQAEAARSLGFTFTQSLRYVILPPAFRTMVQPLVNIFIGVVLGSSLASAVGVSELTNRTQVLNLQSAEAVVLFLVSGAIYLVIALLGGAAGGALERRVSGGRLSR